jgi:hypothetical protein
MATATASAKAFHDRNPYPGPRSFSPDERSVFCGRHYESRQLFSLVVAHKVVLLYSQSGAGKSSLLNAGLTPLLEEEGFKVFPVARVAGRIPDSVNVESVPNPYAFNVLLSWSLRETGLEPRQLATVSLDQFLKRDLTSINADRSGTVRVLLFDQFEELFTFYPERWKERGEFIKQLAEALDADDYLRVVIGMREEYLGPLQVHAQTLPESMETRFRLELLGKDDALAAVIEPLKTTRRHFAPNVAERLVEDLLKIKVATDHASTREVTGEYVEPVQLQVVCSGLWDKLPSETQEVTFEYLQDFGDVTDALSAFYEESLNDTAQKACVTEGKLRKWFEQTLITPAGTRGTVFRGTSETGGLANAAVDALEAKHIIRCDSRAGSAWYELTHDRFIDPILKSNAQWRKAHGALEQLRRGLEERAEKWDQAGRPAGELLTEDKLREAQRWLNDPKALELGCSEKVLAFVGASAEEAQRQKEHQRQIEERAHNATRLRKLAAVLAIVCLFAIAAAAFAMQKVSEAKNQRAAAINATNLATQKERAAVRSAEALRIQALRIRQENLATVENDLSFLDSLIQKSSPSEAVDWHEQKARLLIRQERLDDAVQESSAAVAAASGYGPARTSRGYARMLQNRPSDALQDFEYVRDHIDSKDTLNYLNLTITLAQLAREAKASESLDQAILYSWHGQNNGGAEEMVPAEIREATGRDALYANGEIFRQALYFMKPLLDACWGRESFAADLEAAEKHGIQDGISQSEKEDAALIALTWGWFLDRAYESNSGRTSYGLSAGKGMLWEEAGYAGRARRHFEAFQAAYAKNPDAKYVGLAAWIRNRRMEPEQAEFSFAKEDRTYLEAQSALLAAQENYVEAERLATQAIELDQNNVRLYFNRMNIYFQMAEKGKLPGQEQQLYSKVVKDCDRVLEKQKDNPDAYFMRAVANSRLSRPERDIISDLKRTTELSPAYGSAIESLAYEMQKSSPEHPERAAEWFARHDRFFPQADAPGLAQRANLQNKMKRYADAYDTIQRAIALDPANDSYYQTRVDAEKGLGYSEFQIQRDRAEGDRVAMEFLRRRNHEEDLTTAKTWEQDRWKILSALGDKSTNEQLRCNADVTTCVTFRVIHEHGESAYMRITSVQGSSFERPIVMIDRGADYGVVLGSAGEVYSPPSEENGHERPAAKIGSAEVLSVGPQSSLLKLKVENPKGDSTVRVGDAVRLTVRTPPIEKRSKLWTVLNYSIALTNLREERIVDFRTLYNNESPELDQTIYQKLLDDIRETGRLYGENMDGGNSISAGKFAAHPKRLRQILEETTPEDLDHFFDYVLKFPAAYFGHDSKIGALYANWVQMGMPEN